jgi:hypothetical protein
MRLRMQTGFSLATLSNDLKSDIYPICLECLCQTLNLSLTTGSAIGNDCANGKEAAKGGGRCNRDH